MIPWSVGVFDRASRFHRESRSGHRPNHSFGCEFVRTLMRLLGFDEHLANSRKKKSPAIRALPGSSNRLQKSNYSPRRVPVCLARRASLMPPLKCGRVGGIGAFVDNELVHCIPEGVEIEGVRGLISAICCRGDPVASDAGDAR